MKNSILKERKQISDERNPEHAIEYVYRYLSNRFTIEDIIAIATEVAKKADLEEQGNLSGQ